MEKKVVFHKWRSIKIKSCRSTAEESPSPYLKYYPLHIVDQILAY